MLTLLKKEFNKTYTENGAVTHQTTMSDCLDFFASAGALRQSSPDEITMRFMRAYAEDSDMAMKILFYTRDVRGGLGERRTFRAIMRWLCENHPQSVQKNMKYIAEFGRYDDLLCLMDMGFKKKVIEMVKEQLAEDVLNMSRGESISLMAKWLPSINASSDETVKQAKVIAKALGMNYGDYRKLLSRLRNHLRIIENNLRTRDYTFDYSKQPSKAMFKYRGAFYRNDRERYTDFLGKVTRGEAKLNTGNVMPYEIIAPVVGGAYNKSTYDVDSLDVTWKNLEDFTDGRNAIAVVDGSGSMYCGGNPMPASVALSLGLYFAERNTGAFKDHFITFSHTPRLVEVKGKNIVEKIKYAMSFNEVADTNIEAVFKLILKTAVLNGVKQAELPETIYIISDMEFNHCASGADITNFQNAKKLFEKYGYKLPQVVFWNVNSRNIHQPVTMNEQGVVLVSGCTPRIFSQIAAGNFSPYEFMLDVINSERYADIAA